MNPAPFITIEGVDGAGKSSHMDAIVAVLEGAGYEVVATREPGGTDVGQSLREQLKTVEMDQTTAALIAFADRNEHLTRKILPALAQGKAVISDRFTDSTYAYQGGGDGCDWGVIQSLESLVQKGLQPHLTLFFDLDNEVAAARRASRAAELPASQRDKFDEKPLEWFAGVRDAYHARVAAQPDRFILIDSSKTLEQVREQVVAALEGFVADFKANPGLWKHWGPSAEHLAQNSSKMSRSPKP